MWHDDMLQVDAIELSMWYTFNLKEIFNIFLKRKIIKSIIMWFTYVLCKMTYVLTASNWFKLGIVLS